MSDLIERLEQIKKDAGDYQIGSYIDYADYSRWCDDLDDAITVLRERESTALYLEKYMGANEKLKQRIVKLEGLIEAYEASVNYPRPEDVDRIAELEAENLKLNQLMDGMDKYQADIEKTRPLAVEIINLRKQAVILTNALNNANKRIAELDDLRQHFETKYKKQCQINMRLDAALAAIDEHIRDPHDSEHDAYVELKLIARKARAGDE